MKTDGIWIKDDDGRTLILRGVNLSGATKVPVRPDGASYKKDSLLDSRNVSFVGRPFPIEEADEHFSRLKYWGLTFLRFLVTWEAIEHAGPGIYDAEYLGYLHSVIAKAAGYGIEVFIDPHQDVWSRWTGGDGAPGWTLELLGIDISKLHQSGASFLHAYHNGPMPKMMWPTNMAKYGTATMFSLFFGGNDFAPKTSMEGRPIQDFLQDHYIGAIRQVANVTSDLPNVIGFDTLNEPNKGYIGIENIETHRDWLKYGYWHTAFQSMLLASGYPQVVPYYEFRGFNLKRVREDIVNPEKVSIWKKGYECIWKANGVWTDGKGDPQLLLPRVFAEKNGKKIDFASDYLKPFVKKYIAGIRKVQPKTLIFIEEALGTEHIPLAKEDTAGCINATHWYDFKTLFTKSFDTFLTIDPEKGVKPVFGEKSLIKEFVRQIGRKKSFAEKMGDIPTLIGEFGIAFDLNNKKAYKTGNFRKHEQAIGVYFAALDELLLSATMWNYTPDNSNEHGDLWNGEDLSIFSRDQGNDKTDPSSGGRAVRGFVRPYAKKIAGMPLLMSFDRRSRVFKLLFKSDKNAKGATEIFVPIIQYPNGYEVILSDGSFTSDNKAYMVFVTHSQEKDEHSVVIRPKKS